MVLADFDSHKNFAYSTIATAPSPATSGTSLVVQTGDGALFPTPPFNAVIWPNGSLPLASNAEIVRVTGISTDTFTITRTQEGTSARTVVNGDQISAAITVKTLTDVETSLFSDQATVDFGFGSGGEGDTAVVTVSGTTWVETDSIVSVSPFAGTTTDHDPEDVVIEGIMAYSSNLVVGTSFDIIAYAPQGTWGKYLINWRGIK